MSLHKALKNLPEIEYEETFIVEYKQMTQGPRNNKHGEERKKMKKQLRKRRKREYEPTFQ